MSGLVVVMCDGCIGFVVLVLLRVTHDPHVLRDTSRVHI